MGLFSAKAESSVELCSPGQFDISIGDLHKEIQTLCIKCAGGIGQGWEEGACQQAGRELKKKTSETGKIGRKSMGTDTNAHA